jgi:predicted RecB family nuclease
MPDPHRTPPEPDTRIVEKKTTIITREVFQSYLLCKLKGHLKLMGEPGSPSDYETMMTRLRAGVANGAAEKLGARQTAPEVARDIRITTAALKQGTPLILRAIIEAEGVRMEIDGLKRMEGPSKLGHFHYIPILFYEGEKVRSDQRRFLELCGLLVGDLQGKQPSHGLIVHGERLKTSKIDLKSGPRSTRRIIEEVKALASAGSSPRLMLNNHCPVCQFRQRCHAQAVKEDNLSLIRGIGEKEVRAYARKGIFTVTQLSHTFRPRRKGKRGDRGSNKRYHALQALAIRDRSIYVLGTPEAVTGPVSIYLDVEGKPDEGFVYLIGMVIVRDGEKSRFSFWADDRGEEDRIFEQFLDEVERFDEFHLFCYGGYEKAFLNRMKKRTARVDLADRVIGSLCNTLSWVYSNFYFPCYSNGLKDVAPCLGFKWTSEGASGVQSIAWRMKWETSGDEEWKRLLITYNMEDCLALKSVTEFIRSVGAKSADGPPQSPPEAGGTRVAWVHEIDKLANNRKWGPTPFVHPEYTFINSCARFDYQREHVFVRTGKRLGKGQKKRSCVFRNKRLRVNRKYVIVSMKCPNCSGTDIELDPEKTRVGGQISRVRRAFDLVITSSGLRRKVIECRSPRHRCRGCGERFIPESYRRLDKHHHNLKSWAMYLHVAHRHSFQTLQEIAKDLFGLTIHSPELVDFKTQFAMTYRATYDRLLSTILAGQVMHVDETEVKLKSGKGYVWVFASVEEVIYMYRPTREGDFLKELLKDFHGVLVSDFYAAYDSLDCPQQKCLIHLMRDINQDLLCNPFDEELKGITRSFGILLRAIVSTVDQHGLSRRHLKKHDREVASFFRSLTNRSFCSETAVALRDKLLRWRDKLFTFVRCDGVTWNNNNAENAIKRFAYYREDTIGVLTEAGLADYLVLLSLFQTCRYKGVSFYKYLLSREQDIDAFRRRKRSVRQAPVIEVYSPGYVPYSLRPRCKPNAEGQDE